MTSNLQTILQNPDEFPWNRSLYLSFSEKWNLSSPCMILDSADGTEDDDEDHPEAIAVGFEYVLSIQQIQDIISNLLAQRPDASMDQRLEAFFYYYDHDAFLNLDSSAP